MLWPTFYSDFIKILGVMAVIAIGTSYIINNTSNHCALGKWRNSDSSQQFQIYSDNTAVYNLTSRNLHCTWDAKSRSIIVLQCD